MNFRGPWRLQRRSLPAAVIALMITVTVNASGQEDPIAADAFAVVCLSRPLQILEHPLVARVWDELSRSETIQRSLASPKGEPIRQIQQFVELATGANLQEGLEKMTAGGVLIAVSPGPPPRLTGVITADNEETWTRVLNTALEVARARVARHFDLPSQAYRGQTGYKAGELYFGVIGRRLVASNDADHWKRAVDWLLDHRGSDSPEAASLAGTEWAENGGFGIARLSVNLEAVRQLPKLAPLLKFPSNRAEVVTLWGGWIDLLRRGDRLNVDLLLSERGAELGARITNLAEPVTSGLEGYFALPREADGAGPRAAPLLEVPDRIYSASWYRDYKSMWHGRADLLTDETRKRLEKADADLATQFSVVRVKDAARTSEIVSELGPHFRVVVARRSEPAYRVTLADRLPSAALVVDVRDEDAFRARLEPILRGISLIFTFQAPGMRPKALTHGGAKLVCFVFADDAVSAEKGNNVRFNFDPTYTFARGHFIIGSTHEIVRNCIDELDRQSADVSRDELSAGTTELQFLSLGHLARALEDYTESIVRSTVLNQGLTVPEAQHELDVLERALATIGELQLRVRNRQNTFDATLSITPAEPGESK